MIDIPDFHKKVGIDDFSCRIDKIKSDGTYDKALRRAELGI